MKTNILKKWVAIGLSTALAVAPMSHAFAKVDAGAWKYTSAKKAFKADVADNLEANKDRDAFSFKSSTAKKAVLKKAESYPSSFDLRDVDGKNYVTQVKFQNPFGSCWSFAAISAAETSLLYEYGVTNEEYEKEVGEELNLSEKALAWFSLKPLTKEDVGEDVPASQIGEGSILPGKDPNEPYDLGGFMFYASGQFASGAGPKAENQKFVGEANEKPYAYRGLKGYTDYDILASGTDAEKQWYREIMYKKYIANKVGPEEEFDSWYEKRKKSILAKGTGEGSCYTPADDWTIPVDYEHRMGQVAAVLQESRIMKSPVIKDPGTDACVGTDEAALAQIKGELLAGRPVSIGFHSDQSRPGQTIPQGKDVYINAQGETWAHYTYNDLSATHAVTIVGYDDNYSRNNFLKGVSTTTGNSKTPPGDGAFIVKNSWGSMNDKTVGKHNQNNWGVNDSGYFYLSYYDKSIELPESFDFYTEKDADAPTGYHYYTDQYDFMLSNNVYSLSDSAKSSMANVFKARYDQKLFDIATQTGSPDTTVTYEVYRLKKNYNNPMDGKLLDKGKKKFAIGGFHKIHLNGEYTLSKGERFSVVITQTVSTDVGTNYEILCNMNRDGEFNGVINRGESLLYRNGVWMDWSDLTQIVKMTYKQSEKLELSLDNFGIKAYSYAKPDQTQKVTVKDKTVTVNSSKGSAGKVSITAGCKTSGDGKLSYVKKSGSAKIRVTKDGKVYAVKGTKSGTCKIRVEVTASETNLYKKASKLMKVTVKVKRK